MSVCTNCLDSNCRRHPLQDHGKRSSEMRAQAKRVKSDMLGDLIKSSIEREQAKDRGTEAEELETYKRELAEEREKLLNKKPKKRRVTAEEEALSKNSTLHSSVVSAMLAHSGSSGSSSSEGESESGDRERRRRSKKEKKAKKDKKSKKDKRDRKEKRHRRDKEKDSEGDKDHAESR